MPVGIGFMAYTHGFWTYTYGFLPWLNVKFLVVEDIHEFKAEKARENLIPLF
jgi:hypothetical protein